MGANPATILVCHDPSSLWSLLAVKGRIICSLSSRRSYNITDRHNCRWRLSTMPVTSSTYRIELTKIPRTVQEHNMKWKIHS